MGLKAAHTPQGLVFGPFVGNNHTAVHARRYVFVRPPFHLYQRLESAAFYKRESAVPFPRLHELLVERHCLVILRGTTPLEGKAQFVIATHGPLRLSLAESVAFVNRQNCRVAAGFVHEMLLVPALTVMMLVCGMMGYTQVQSIFAPTNWLVIQGLLHSLSKLPRLVAVMAKTELVGI